jgi:hypothetical protein
VVRGFIEAAWRRMATVALGGLGVTDDVAEGGEGEGGSVLEGGVEASVAAGSCGDS